MLAVELSRAPPGPGFLLLPWRAFYEPSRRASDEFIPPGLSRVPIYKMHLLVFPSRQNLMRSIPPSPNCRGFRSCSRSFPGAFWLFMPVCSRLPIFPSYRGTCQFIKSCFCFFLRLVHSFVLAANIQSVFVPALLYSWYLALSVAFQVVHIF